MVVVVCKPILVFSLGRKLKKNDNTMKLEFSKNFNGNVNQMVEIARKFKENIEIIDEIFKQ